MGKIGRAKRARANFQDTDGLPGVFVGGRDIRVPVQLSLNQTVGSYAGVDTLDITHQDTDNYALFPIRQISGSLVIVGRDQRGNKGDAAIYSLLEGKIMALENSLRMNISEQIYSDGTGNGGKDLDGLAAVCGNGTLAGLNPTTFPAWQPGMTAGGSALTTRAGNHTTSTAFATSDAGIIAMRSVFLNVSQGADQTDGIFMAPIHWREYEAEMTPQIRYQAVNGDASQADATFQTLFFEGAPVFWDHDCPTGAIYMLNSRHIAFMRDSAADFVWLGDPQRPVDQDVLVRNMIVEGNVVTDNRRFLGQLSLVT
jgi:hypothetical protein